MDRITHSLRQYIEAEIIPRYYAFDKAHRRDHVETVIDQGLKLSAHYDVDPNIIYAAAAYHDTGLVEGHWERTVEHLLEKCPIGNHHIIFCGDYNKLFKAFVSVVL